jgi:hypothetical protein
LVVGGGLAIFGGVLPPYRQWFAPLEEGLRVIATHRLGWWSIHACFLLGTIVAAAGLALVAFDMRGQPGGVASSITAIAFGFAAVFWAITIVCRLSVNPWAAEQLLQSGSIPAAFEPWRRFTSLMFAAYSALGYASVAGVGVVLLQADRGPRWLGWLVVVWGASAGFVFGANVPLIMYIPFVIQGGILLQPTR